MTVIDEQYIKYFLPIQELDAVSMNPATHVADVKPDDLFMMSQLSAYATADANAIAVSKKIRYQDLLETLSSDMSIGKIKFCIDELSNNLSVLSGDSEYLSDAIVLSVFNLSTYIDSSILDLSNAVSSNYVKNYSNIRQLIKRNNDPANPATFVSKMRVDNGIMTQLETIDVSSVVVPKDWKLGESGIRTDFEDISSISGPNRGNNIISCALRHDYYVVGFISAYENDATNSPLQVYLSGPSPTTGAIVSTLVKEFNNPGGFSGKQYYNFYTFELPVKSWSDVTIVIRYSDGSSIHGNTKTKIIGYIPYTIATKDDLSGYVRRQSSDVRNALEANTDPSQNLVYKIRINEDGLISSAQSAYYGPATTNDLGLVKLNTSFNDPNYALQLSSNQYAYVQVPHATSSKFGTTKLAPQAETQYGNYVVYGVRSATSGDYLFTSISVAQDTKYGLIKTNDVKYDGQQSNDGLSAYLQHDEEGHGFVVIPRAQYDRFGLIKFGLNENSRLTVSRSVYIDTDGYPKVNVAANYGVGQYYNNETDKGYDIHETIRLTEESRVDASSIHDTVSILDDQAHECSDFGSYVWKLPTTINVPFAARVIYHGTGLATYSSNATMQIVCDGNVVTTINPYAAQTGDGKQFVYSQDLGIFDGDNKMFAVISNTENFGNDKIHFIIKRLSDN